jgi:hypothetical protein
MKQVAKPNQKESSRIKLYACTRSVYCRTEIRNTKLQRKQFLIAYSKTSSEESSCLGRQVWYVLLCRSEICGHDFLSDTDKTVLNQ